MKFYGQPNLHIIDFRTKKLHGKFNNKGEFETNDEELIKRLKQHFKSEEDKPPRKGVKK